MKKYFSVNIFDDDIPVLLHDTLDEAQKACLHNATQQYDYACDIEDIDEYECVADEAIYGVVMGQCVSSTRAANKDDTHEGQYDYIVEAPKLVEHNGWIKCSERLPDLSSWGFSRELILWGLEEEHDHEEFMFMGTLMKDGKFYSARGECFNVTHWQPLPGAPATEY